MPSCRLATEPPRLSRPPARTARATAIPAPHRTAPARGTGRRTRLARLRSTRPPARPASMAPMARRRDVLTPGAIAVLVIAADQASKVWAQGSLRPDHEITVITGWLWFRLTSNSGASLGLLRGHNLLFLVVSLLVVVAVAVIVVRGAPGTAGAVALGAVAGGATSNLIDRVRLGSVIDFIEVHLWPTDFNLADAAIRLGVLAFVLTIILGWRRRPLRDAGSRPEG